MAVLCIALIVGVAGTPSSMNFAFEVLIWTVIAASWNFLARMGYVSLATAAWYGLGEYATAVLMVHYGLNFYLSVGIAALLIFVFAVVSAVPMLRIRSHYFIMGTFFLAVVIGEAVGQIQGLGINGQSGMYLPVTPGGMGVGSYRYLLAMSAVLLVLTAVVSGLLRSGRLRYAVRAIGEDEDAATILGVANVRVKLLLCGVSAGLIGIAGALQAYSIGVIYPSSAFDLSITVDAVIIGVLGGIGSLPGAVLGAAIIQYVALVVGPSSANLASVIYGVIVLVVVLALPRGLAPSLGVLGRSALARWPKSFLVEGPVDSPTIARGRHAVAFLRGDAPSRELQQAAILPADVPQASMTFADTDGLSVVGLAAGYGLLPVLHDVTLIVAVGERVGVLGPNGAGKTTLVRVISGVLKPTRGTVWWHGERIDGMATHEIARRGVSVIPEGRQVYPGMSVEENLLVGAGSVGRKRAAEQLGSVYELIPMLAERRTSMAGALSGGQQQLCAIGRAVMSNPSLLIVDELSLGLAPRAIVGVVDVLTQVVANSSATLLVIDQDLGIVETFARRGYFLDGGRVAASGDLERLHEVDAVRTIYFGDENAPADGAWRDVR